MVDQCRESDEAASCRIRMASIYSPAANAHSTNVAGSHALSRSAELLSCAKTAVKIAKTQHNGSSISSPPPHGTWWSVDPSDLQLHNNLQQAHQQVLEDGVSLLRTMDAELKHLEALVRRRGQTNDPTEEITLSVNRLQMDTQELAELVQTMVPVKARGQRQRHWQILQQWFQSTTQHQGDRLKEILKIRGTVLKEQAQRRGRFQTLSNSTTSKSATSVASRTSLNHLDSPLFNIHAARVPTASTENGIHRTAPGVTPLAPTPPIPRHAPAPPLPIASSTNGGYSHSGNTRHAAMGSGYGGSSSSSAMGGAGYGSGGYGGGIGTSYYPTASAGNIGMRQRRAAVQEQDLRQHQEQEYQQTQLLQRQQDRETALRLQDARRAEKSLAELGTLFGKMSNLVSQQGEVLSKVEDDVEAGYADVLAGQQEIAIVYSLKKGNRALIIKVFALLIFLIIFMKAYKSK
jgi:hypothetical protein